MNKPHHLLSMSTLAAAVSVSLIAAQAMAQSGLPYTIEAPQGSRAFGSRVASGGDANNDGYDDIFVVDDGAEENGDILGHWYMYSGVDGSLLWSGMGSELSEEYTHFSAEFLGDLDGDNCDEVVLGRSRLLDSRGGVDVFSGRTGELIYSYRGADPEDRMGWAISGLGDLNDDDVPDFGFNTRYTLEGEVSIRSGRDGGEIRTIDIAWPRQIRDAGHVDRDLVRDIALSSWHHTQYVHAVSTLSGVDGRLIWEIARDSRFGGDYYFAYQIAAGADVTGDDVADVLASGELGFDGTAYLLSGADGSQIATYEHPANPYGQRVQLLGVNLEFADLTGDGHAEVVAGGAEQILIFEPLTARILSRRTKWESRIEYSGTELAVGDVNSDGLTDLVVGLLEQYPGGGSAHVTSGGSLLLHLVDHGQWPRNRVRAGYAYEFSVYSGSPGRTIRLLGSRVGHDCTFVPRLGICIDLDRRIYLLGTANTDPDGFAIITVDVPNRTPAGPLWLQALDINDPTRGPIRSNVLEIEVVRP